MDKNNINSKLNFLISITIVILILIVIMLLIIPIKEKTIEKKKCPIIQQMCSNQELWDKRTEYPDFNCEMYHTKNGIIRVCSATDVKIKNFNITKEKIETICLEKQVGERDC